MPGTFPHTSLVGPRTYPVTEAILGGQLVEARAGSVVGVAAAGSVKCLGVALIDAAPSTSTDTYSAAVDATLIAKPSNVTVGLGEWPVTYTAAANFGDPLICAANGQVTPAGATPDARTIVGKCSELAGVGAGAVGKALICPV